MNGEFKSTPEGRKFVEDLVASAKRWKPAINRCVKRIAEKCAADVRLVVERQTFPNARISKAWMDRKAREGLDPRVLIATRKYIKSIQPMQVQDGVWAVTCSDLELRKRLEFGTRTMKARPHWGPVLDEYQRNFAKLFAKEVLNDVFGKGQLT